MRKSPYYQFTVDLKTGFGLTDVTRLRRALRNSNKRVCLKGRLGPNNPNNKFYKGKNYQTIKLEHARYADVYIYSK